MSSLKKEEKPHSSKDPTNNMEAMLRQFGNLLQQRNERMERLEARMVKIERKQGIFNPRRQEKCAPTFVENILREFDCGIERFKEFVEKENKKKRE